MSQEQAPQPPRGLSPGLVRLMTITCAVTVANLYEQWGWTGASVTAAAFSVLGLVAWLAGRRHEVSGEAQGRVVRTAARASRAPGTSA